MDAKLHTAISSFDVNYMISVQLEVIILLNNPLCFKGSLKQYVSPLLYFFMESICINYLQFLYGISSDTMGSILHSSSVNINLFGLNPNFYS